VEVAERREAGAEIVDREPHAHVLEGGEVREVLLGVIHEDRFRHLEHRHPAGSRLLSSRRLLGKPPA
jgi:hypothetical protein